MSAPQSTTPSSSVKRQVHFADSHTVVEYVCHRKELTQVEKHQLWWRPSDFKAIMNEALENAFETRKHRHILCDGLDQAMQRARRMAHIVQGDNETCKTSEGKPSSFYNMHDYLSNVLEADLGLRVWSEYGPTRRGLERLGASSEAHQHARNKITRKGVAMVVTFSQRLPNVRSAEHQDGNDCELIRRVAEHTSRSSVIFARMMGLADAHAAGKLGASVQLCGLSSSINHQKLLPTKKLPSRQALLKSDQYQSRRRVTATGDAHVNVVVRC